MDHIPPTERDFTVDLESGGTIDEVGSTYPVFGAKLAKKNFTKVCSGLVSFDGSVSSETGVSLSSSMLNGSKDSHENVKLLRDKKAEGEEAVDIAEKKKGDEKRKMSSPKKHSKPPRPPRGPSLDAVDQKLIKEISEIVMIKRARTERMKALKRMKAAKASTSNGNLFAMLFTILFCLVIIFQGMSLEKVTHRFTGFSGFGSQELKVVSFHLVTTGFQLQLLLVYLLLVYGNRFPVETLR